jgi:hypothetical protein
MRCSDSGCRHSVEGEFDEILARGYGFCPRGHKTDVPGSTKEDLRCECGARASNQPAHSYWCPEAWKRSFQ